MLVSFILTECFSIYWGSGLAGGSRESCESLYLSLKSAVISDTKVTIENNIFPVEEDEGLLGGTIFLRQAHKDLWRIFESQMLMNSCRVMCIMGPSGVGKSWNGMNFLVNLIKLNRTVVFESLPMQGFWVFKEKGSYFSKGTALHCLELRDEKTVYIFDSKAGQNAYEPAMTKAKLVYIMSINDIGKQTKLRSKSIMLIFPSLSKKEYLQYANEFEISNDDANELAVKVGHGKIRPLRTNDYSLNDSLEIATAAMVDIGTFEPNPEITPALWLDAFLPEEEILDDGNLDETIESLTKRYLYYNSNWSFASAYVFDQLKLKFPDQMNGLFEDILNNIRAVNYRKTFGSLCGSLAENIIPQIIAKEGLLCSSFHDASETLKIFIHTIENTEVQNIDDILKNCKDSNVLYFIGKNMPGFDLYNPPNNFFLITTTLTSGSGNHPLLYSTFAELNKNLKTVNVILVVDQNQQDKWKNELSYKINVQSVVESINVNERNKNKLFKINGQRKFDKLPGNIQSELNHIKPFVGFVIIKRKYTSVRMFCNFAVRLIK